MRNDNCERALYRACYPAKSIICHCYGQVCRRPNQIEFGDGDNYARDCREHIAKLRAGDGWRRATIHRHGYRQRKSQRNLECNWVRLLRAGVWYGVVCGALYGASCSAKSRVGYGNGNFRGGWSNICFSHRYNRLLHRCHNLANQRRCHGERPTAVRRCCYRYNEHRCYLERQRTWLLRVHLRHNFR